MNDSVPVSDSPVSTHPLPVRSVFSTWWPLAASWLMMGLELPAVSAVIARLAYPEIHLAAYGGALATAGDVVFYGTMEGWLKAVHAKTGEVRWKFKTGSGIIANPMTYLGPDGKQYVAVLSGVGGWSGAIVAGELDPRDGTAALGFVNAMADLPDHTTKGGMLYAFALP